jgi:hypothetical protein
MREHTNRYIYNSEKHNKNDMGEEQNVPDVPFREPVAISITS